jgi:hypothetical protein
MTTEETYRLLRKFISTDIIHRNMDNPFITECRLGKFYTATNGRKVLLLPVNGLLNEEGLSDKHPAVDKIIPSIFELDVNIDINALTETFNGVETIDIPNTEECESCDGMGSFTHWGNSYDCKNCDEKGVVQLSSTYKGKDPKYCFEYEGKYIQVDYIENLMEIISLVSKYKEVFTLKLLSNKGIFWFQINDIYFGLCPIFEPTDKIVRIKSKITQ